MRHIHRIAAATVLCTSMLFVWILSPATADSEYVRSERLELHLDQRVFQTSLPLNPAHQYEVLLVSPYTLKPLIDFARRHCPSFRLTDCDLPILVNGGVVPIFTYASDTDAAFFVKPHSDVPDAWDRYYVPTLKLIMWGTGRPLRLQSTADFSEAVPAIAAEVTDIPAQQQQEREEYRAKVTMIGIAAGVVIFILIITCAVYQESAPAREKRRVAQLGQQIEDELKVLEKIQKGLSE